MKPNPFISRVCHSLILRLAVTLLVLACSRLAFCGEIQDAADKGDFEKVKSLLKANPDLVFSKNDDGNTPLHSAVRFDHKDIAEFLLANKAEVDARDKWNDWTSLHIAAFDGYKDVAELLLTNKADVNAKGKWDMTPLCLAAGKGHKEMVELLLASKAEVNAKDSHEGMTPLHVAAFFGHKDVAALLMASKANINATNSAGFTPLHLAVAQKHEDVADLLRQHGGHE